MKTLYRIEVDKEAELSIQKKMKIWNKYDNQKTVKSYCKNFNPYEKEKTRASLLSFTGL